jgi:hypothetical protein
MLSPRFIVQLPDEPSVTPFRVLGTDGEWHTSDLMQMNPITGRCLDVDGAWFTAAPVEASC